MYTVEVYIKFLARHKTQKKKVLSTHTIKCDDKKGKVFGNEGANILFDGAMYLGISPSFVVG